MNEATKVQRSIELAQLIGQVAVLRSENALLRHAIDGVRELCLTGAKLDSSYRHVIAHIDACMGMIDSGTAANAAIAKAAS